MSTYSIYLKDGAKFMHPVTSREEYLRLRGTERQKNMVKAVREGDEQQKRKLLQINYSCLPNPDGSLRGTTQMSTSVGMDIDHVDAADMQPMAERILARKDELGLLMLERSVRGRGFHVVFRRQPELTQEENLHWASELLGVAYDAGAKDITRVFYTTTDSQEDLLYLDDEIFKVAACTEKTRDMRTQPTPAAALPSAATGGTDTSKPSSTPDTPLPAAEKFSLIAFDLCVKEAKLDATMLDQPGVHNWHTNLMAILSVGLPMLVSREQLRAVLAERMPNYSQTDDCRKLIDHFYVKYDAGTGYMTVALRRINSQAQRLAAAGKQTVPPTTMPVETALDDDEEQQSAERMQLKASNMPQGIRDSIAAVGPQMAMPVVTAICPCIGALATGVSLDVHGTKSGLNLIAYIAGHYASGKGSIDPVVEAWIRELRESDREYQLLEREWREQKRAAKNKLEQPVEPKLQVRCITLNNTVANLAERLSNTQGKHAFSFTPEADTVSKQWKSGMSDFSVMVRQSYDGSRYEREARSAEAVSVHIDHLLWNITMCGTPDALHRVVSNCTDGLQSRFAIARTPDNTFAPLPAKPYTLTTEQAERIRQVAHLLPLMKGEVVLPKLEERGSKWLDRIRMESMMDDDTVRARQRFRLCVTAQRMTCCLMLCRVCEGLIRKHGLGGAEVRLREKPDVWRQLLLKAQTPQLLDAFDIIADSLMENSLHFFRDSISQAFSNPAYRGSTRQKPGRNDSIYERLDALFTFDQAMLHSKAVKGTGVTYNSVRQMLKNWRRQGLVVQTDDGVYSKAVGNEQ